VPLRVVEQAFRSDTGRQRTANEDAYFARAPLFAVADGMGGAQAGEVASRMAVESFEPAQRSDESAEGFLRRIVEAANERIHRQAELDTSASGMGTTLTAALVEGDEVSLAHVGDSRAYLYRDGELRLLTSDHSLVEELRRQGRLTDEQASDHPQRSIITRALGPEAEVEIDTMTLSARPGDVYLICSDGLTSMIKEERIGTVLGETDDLDTAASQLVREANAAGGRDNITVVAFRLSGAEEPAVDEGATLIGPSAEEAGLTDAAVGAGAARPEPAAAAPGRRQPAAPPPRRRLRTAAKVAAAVVIVAAICVGAWLGARQIYFLGTDEGGRLALYRGLPYDLPLDISLYSEVLSSPVQVASLPENRQDEATNHDLRSKDDATSLLDDLEQSVPASPSPPNGNGVANRPGAGGSEQQNQAQGADNRDASRAGGAGQSGDRTRDRNGSQ
jgi:PPM family protein phosphatase